MAGDAIYGDVPFSRALVAVTVLAGLHYANSWLSYRKPSVGEWLEGTPTPIVRAGRTAQAGLRERMSEREVHAELRLAGIDDLGEVKLAQVETDGHVSVIREAWAEPLRKRTWSRFTRKHTAPSTAPVVLPSVLPAPDAVRECSLACESIRGGKILRQAVSSVVERLPFKQGVVGSIPTRPTNATASRTPSRPDRAPLHRRAEGQLLLLEVDLRSKMQA